MKLDLDKCIFYKENESDIIYWVRSTVQLGTYFTFDKKRILSPFSDYPYNMTAEEIEIFDRENPFWRNYFAPRFK